MKKLLSSGLAIGAMISLVGCGGGSSSSSTPATVSGQFIDAAVEGLNYTCMSSGLSGVTDNTGTFTCQATDENVTFSIGAYVIGSSTSTSGIVTPYNITADDTAAIDVAQLLQTLDSDDDGVITIPADFTALDDVNATPGSTEFEDEVEAALETTLVSEQTAQVSLDENILLALLGGKTLYTAAEADYFDKWVFDTNLTEANVTDLTSENPSSLLESQLQNGGLQVQSYGLLVLTERTDDYLLFTYNTDQTIKFYFDELHAKAVYEGYIVITEEKLSGKTFYEMEEEYDDGDNAPMTGILYRKLTFSNGTVTVNEVWESNPAGETDSMNFTLPYELIEGKIKVDASSVPDQDPNEPEGFMWFTLDIEGETEWVMWGEEDADKDGTIDDGSGNEFTWPLSKPDGYPDSL